jgi:hypothetical protein
MVMMKYKGWVYIITLPTGMDADKDGWEYARKLLGAKLEDVTPWRPIVFNDQGVAQVCCY